MKKIFWTTSFLLVFACCLFSSTKVTAQDTIYKRSKEIIKAKIIEIGLDEIKYKMPGDEEGATIVIAKDQVWKIIFANGTTQILQPEMDNPETYSNQKKNAFKIDFLAPMFRHFTFIFERSIKPGQSIEGSIGVIGVGYNHNDTHDPSGMFVRIGFKFIKSPDFYLRGMKYAHILKGSYIRPEFVFGSYSDTYTPSDLYNFFGTNPAPVPVTDRVTFGSIQLVFGKQVVLNDAFLVDYYVGLGYASTTHSSSKYDYWFSPFGMQGFGSSPFSISGGVRIGLLF